MSNASENTTTDKELIEITIKDIGAFLGDIVIKKNGRRVLDKIILKNIKREIHL